MTMITAKTILKLLLEKHAKDLCVPECKTGPTWYNIYLRSIDLWIMARSWAKPFMIAYEIKITRNDFLKDEKWQKYLPFCTDFYFVTPPGIIDPKELPPEAGLIVTSKNGRRLFMKKKCVRREVEIPNTIFRYVLMARANIGRERKKKGSKEYWTEWLEEKRANQELGHRVSKKVSRILSEKIDKVYAESHQIQKESEKLQEIKDLITKLGFKPTEILRWGFKERFEQRLKELNAGLPEELIPWLKQAEINLGRAHDLLTKKIEEINALS